MSLILWSQILLRNSSENFRSDIPHPNLVLKSDDENSDHFLSSIWAISEVQRIRLNGKSVSDFFLLRRLYFIFCWLISRLTKWSLYWKKSGFELGPPTHHFLPVQKHDLLFWVLDSTKKGSLLRAVLCLKILWARQLFRMVQSIAP